MLAPTLTIVVVLFGGALVYGFIQSLGYNPRIGNYNISLDAYANILFSEEYREPFWRGLGLTLFVSLASTFISAVIAIGAALLLRQTFVGKRIATFLFQFNLPIPHIVAAVGILFLFSQTGFLSRGLAQAGVVEKARDFPVLVRDSNGIGIITSFVWKEAPFLGVIVLAILQSVGADYENLARSLGANRWQRFRHVTLPLIMPGLLSGSIIVFAFSFGSYEVPAILGVRFPRMLSITTWRFFQDADLNSRAEGTAISIIMALIVLALTFTYQQISRRTIRGG